MKKITYLLYFVFIGFFLFIACKKNSDNISNTEKENLAKALSKKSFLKSMDENCAGNSERISLSWDYSDPQTAGCYTWTLTRNETRKCLETGDIFTTADVIQQANCDTPPPTPDMSPSNPIYGSYISGYSYSINNGPFNSGGFTVPNMAYFNQSYFSTNLMNYIILEDMYESLEDDISQINEDEVLPYDIQGIDRIRYATLATLSTYQFGSTVASTWGNNMPNSTTGINVKIAYMAGISYANSTGDTNINSIILYFKNKIISHQL